MIFNHKSGKSSTQQQEASIPPRAEPGTMQLHTTRPADWPTLERETQTCQLTFLSSIIIIILYFIFYLLLLLLFIIIIIYYYYYLLLLLLLFIIIINTVLLFKDS